MRDGRGPSTIALTTLGIMYEYFILPVRSFGLKRLGEKMSLAPDPGDDVGAGADADFCRLVLDFFTLVV